MKYRCIDTRGIKSMNNPTISAVQKPCGLSFNCSVNITLSSFICMSIYKSLGCLILGFCLKSPNVAPPQHQAPPTSPPQIKYVPAAMVTSPSVKTLCPGTNNTLTSSNIAYLTAKTDYISFDHYKVGVCDMKIFDCGQ